jgi:hypothetical protein
MDKVVLDNSVLAKMAGHSGPFEVWSNSGQLIGVFHPEKKSFPTRPPMTDEEIEAAIARSQREGRLSAAEVRAELLRQRPI